MFYIAMLSIGFTRVLHFSGSGGTTLCNMFQTANSHLTDHQKGFNCNFPGTDPHISKWSEERHWDYLKCSANLSTKVLFFEHTFPAEFPCQNDVKHILLIHENYWIMRLHNVAAYSPDWKKAASPQKKCDFLVYDTPFFLINFILGRHKHTVASELDLKRAMHRVDQMDLVILTSQLLSSTKEISTVTGIEVVPGPHMNHHKHLDLTLPTDCEKRFLELRELDSKLHTHMTKRSKH